MKCRDLYVSAEHRYALGRDTTTGQAYLSIPVSNRRVDYEEYFGLSEGELAQFMADPAAAALFAKRCGRHEEDGRLIVEPGSDRGTYT